ncbi:hypothetical protein NO989_18705 [Alteromonas sp. DY56-G5]
MEFLVEYLPLALSLLALVIALQARCLSKNAHQHSIRQVVMGR